MRLMRYAWGVVLAALLIPAVVVARQSGEDEVDVSAALELWTDVLRDADALGTHVLRVSDREEMALGARVAPQAGPAAAAADQAYVRAVAAGLTPHVRRKGISYEVHVIDAPILNAWAFPGGHIVVTTTMLAFLQSEAELASILGHEIAHVDARHCIDRFEYQVAFGRAGLGGAGGLVDAARRMATAGYSKYQEAEADAIGLRLMIEAGYDPRGAVAPMERMAALRRPAADARPANVVSELGAATANALGEYLASHPEPDERVRRLNGRIRAERRRIARRTLYVGQDGYAKRTPRASSNDR